MMFRQRFLSASKVYDWTTGPVITIPSQTPGITPLPEVAVVSAATGSYLGTGTTGVSVTTGTVAGGDLIIVVGGMSNDSSALVTPTASGLTFTQVHKTTTCLLYTSDAADD